MEHPKEGKKMLRFGQRGKGTSSYSFCISIQLEQMTIHQWSGKHFHSWPCSHVLVEMKSNNHSKHKFMSNTTLQYMLWPHWKLMSPTAGLEESSSPSRSYKYLQALEVGPVTTPVPQPFKSTVPATSQFLDTPQFWAVSFYSSTTAFPRGNQSQAIQHLPCTGFMCARDQHQCQAPLQLRQLPHVLRRGMNNKHPGFTRF